MADPCASLKPVWPWLGEVALRLQEKAVGQNLKSDALLCRNIQNPRLLGYTCKPERAGFKTSNGDRQWLVVESKWCFWEIAQVEEEKNSLKLCKILCPRLQKAALKSKSDAGVHSARQASRKLPLMPRAPSRPKRQNGSFSR